MLILPGARLAVLEAPKTGSLSLRAMLAPLADPASLALARHMGVAGFARRLASPLAARHGAPFQTVAVVREPLGRLESWYRYRMRGRVAALEVSTRGMTFDAFVSAFLDPEPPPFARVGRQDAFVGWAEGRARVDHLFDYARLDLLVGFLADRTGQALVLPLRNRTPRTPRRLDMSLRDATLARLAETLAGEVDLYDAVQAAGHLVRAGCDISSSAR